MSSLAIYTASTLTSHFQDFIKGTQAKLSGDTPILTLPDVKVPSLTPNKAFEIQYPLVEHSYSAFDQNASSSTSAQSVAQPNVA